MLERGFIGGALLVATLSWAPFDSSMPLITSIKTAYVEVFNAAAQSFFKPGWW